MEVTPPPRDFVIDGSAGTGAYSPESAVTNPFASADDTAAGNPFVLGLGLATAVTAPPSPNPFEHLPPGASDADPFDLFQHFTSAPASPARAAAIYAEFDFDGADGNVVDGFHPRMSYSTVTSTVPFEWEEKPGKPKPEFAAVTAATADDADDDFDFGVLLDKAARTQELTTADLLFDEGKIRPLKPPPRLLDTGSVGSSPRSARSMIWSPRLRGTRGSSTVRPGGADFDPFAAALEKAAKAPSPLGVGGRDDEGGVNESASASTDLADSATSPSSTPPANKNTGGRKKWRISDLLLFRRASAKGRAAGNISRDPVFKYAPVKDADNAESVAANGDASSVKHKKQSKKAAASTAAEGGVPMPHKQSVMGCVRLHPGLHRLAKGFNKG